MARPRLGSRCWCAASPPSNSFLERRLLGDQLAIEREIILGHASRRESALEDMADAGTVELMEAPRSRRSLLLVIDDEAGDAIVENLRHRPLAHRDDRGPAGHRLDHCQAEGLAPVDREEQRCRIAEELGLIRIADFAEELDVR